MASLNWVAAADLAKVLKGRFSIVKIFELLDAVAAPITPVDITDSFELAAAPTKWTEDELIALGVGNNPIVDRYDPKVDLSLRVSGGKAGHLLASILQLTWGKVTDLVVPMSFLDYPTFHLEAQYCQADGTVLCSKVYQDCRLRPFDWNTVVGKQEVDIPFMSYEPSFMIHGDGTMVLDKFTADGSTGAYTLSSTPLNLIDITDANLMTDYFLLDEAVYVRVKTSGQVTGTRLTTGVTYATGDINITPVPAVGSVVEVFYAKAR